jgi:hypothetical protein
MKIDEVLSRRFTRRSVCGLMAGVSGSALLSACRSVRSDDDDDSVVDATDDDVSDDVDDEDQDDDVDPQPVVDDDSDDEEADDDADDVDEDPDEEDDVDDVEEEPEAEPRYEVDPDVDVLAGEVVDYQLNSDGEWDGHFGSVTYRLRRGWVDGDDVGYIRADSSDRDFAQQLGLVYAPALGNVLDLDDGVGELYIFEGGPAGQLPVMSVTPADGDRYSGAFRVHRVMYVGKTATPLVSEEEVLDAAELDNVLIFDTDIVVNFPVVIWPGGQLAVDEEGTEALGGQLLAEPDFEAGEVTFKLHQAYPGNRYIIADVVGDDPETLMESDESDAAQALIDAGATTSLEVFLNGPLGPGLMGHQPEISDAEAGSESWSPFAELHSVEWVDEDDAVPVTSAEELDALAESGDVLHHDGAPNGDGVAIVLNCPSPIFAAVTWNPDE